MDSMNLLMGLGGDIAEAKNAVDLAIRKAESLALDDEPADRGEPEQPGLGTLIDKLAAIRALLAGLPGEEMAKAIEQAHDEWQDGSDRADAASY